MVTPLQRAFAKSKILQRALREYLAAEGIPAGKFWSDLLQGIIFAMTEAQIKTQLLELLQHYDITNDERAEILKLLRLSKIALTEEQTAQLLELLF